MRVGHAGRRSEEEEPVVTPDTAGFCSRQDLLTRECFQPPGKTWVAESVSLRISQSGRVIRESHTD